MKASIGLVIGVMAGGCRWRGRNLTAGGGAKVLRKTYVRLFRFNPQALKITVRRG
jgi:hypothetical protein